MTTDSLLRRCARCRAESLPVVHTVRHTVGSETRGVRYNHECFGCGATFFTLSTGRLIYEAAPWIFFLAVGLGLFGLGAVSGLDSVRSGAHLLDLAIGVALLLGGAAILRFAARAMHSDVVAPLRAHLQNPRVAAAPRSTPRSP